MVLFLTLLSLALMRINSFVHAQDSAEDFDPLTDFCRRFAHRTAVIDRRLYIDGGYVDYRGGVYPDTVNYTNSYLLYLDLEDIVETFPVLYTNLSKPSEVPSVVGGTIWPDTVNKYLYLYGGEYNWTSTPPSRYTLWYYDVLYDTWDAKTGDSEILLC